MQNQTIRIVLYSSVAITLLAFVWGLRQIPQQNRLAEQALRESLDQELIVLSGAVKASNQALKYRLLDVLKAEGNDHATRAFQDSPFQVATLLEWDEAQWKTLWYSSKAKSDLPASELKNWQKDWPLSKLALDDVYYAKVADLQGQAYFAMLVPVRRPNQVPMVGVGIFPANQFGLSFSADENREIRVFTDQGLALSLTHPAYLGASLRPEPLVRAMLEGDEVSVRHDWTNEKNEKYFGLASRIGESNLFAAIEARHKTGSPLQAWAYLIVCALSAGALNWVLFASLLKPLLTQLSETEQDTEVLRRELDKRIEASLIPAAKLGQLDFLPTAAQASVATIAPVALPMPGPAREKVAAAPEMPGQITLRKVVQSALQSLDGRIKEFDIKVKQIDLDTVGIENESPQLQTAIEEILKNAIEAMTDVEERQLTISGHRLGARNRLRVEDSGSGIAESDLGKVFDPFFSTKDSQGVARGLGLNVVRRVVEEMNGRVHLQPVRPGQPTAGTRVDIEWPSGQLAAAPDSGPTPIGVFNLDDETGDLDQLARIAQSPRNSSAAISAAATASASAADRHWPEFAIRRPKVRNLD